MPKVRISEIDATGVIQNSSVSNTVFIPIQADTSCKANFGPILVSSRAQLDNLKTSGGSDGNQKAKGDDIGYIIADYLLQLGFKVVVMGIKDSDGTIAMTAKDWALLEDKNLYDLRFLTAGSLTGENRVSKDMITCAKNRGDCIALIDLDEEADGFDYTATAVRAAFDTALKNEENFIAGLDYAAAFTPWFNIENIDKLIPASYGYLFAYANSIRTNPEYYSIAGSFRGVIPNMQGVAHEYSSADIEILQGRSAAKEVDLDAEQDNVGFAINPIANIRPFGHIIYGNRTLKDNKINTETNTGITTATSFLNIRNMLCIIKKMLYNASRKYAFEQNTTTLWLNFQSYITPILDSMQQGNGILGYKFTRQATQAKARLKAKLTITPIEAVEDFDIEVLMTDDITTVNE